MEGGHEANFPPCLVIQPALPEYDSRSMAEAAQCTHSRSPAEARALEDIEGPRNAIRIPGTTQGTVELHKDRQYARHLDCISCARLEGELPSSEMASRHNVTLLGTNPGGCMCPQPEAAPAAGLMAHRTHLPLASWFLSEHLLPRKCGRKGRSSIGATFPKSSGHPICPLR